MSRAHWRTTHMSPLEQAPRAVKGPLRPRISVLGAPTPLVHFSGACAMHACEAHRPRSTVRELADHSRSAVPPSMATLYRTAAVDGAPRPGSCRRRAAPLAAPMLSTHCSSSAPYAGNASASPRDPHDQPSALVLPPVLAPLLARGTLRETAHALMSTTRSPRGRLRKCNGGGGGRQGW